MIKYMIVIADGISMNVRFRVVGLSTIGDAGRSCLYVLVVFLRVIP